MKSQPLLSNKRDFANQRKMLGELLRVRRSLLGLSLVDASAAARVPMSVLTRMENGNAVRTDLMFKVLHCYGQSAQVRAKDVTHFAVASSGPLADLHEAAARDIPNRELPIFSVSQLEITPRRTPEDIRRAIAEGRIAELTPGLAGD